MVQPHVHTHAVAQNEGLQRLKHVAVATGLLGTALLTHRLPGKIRPGSAFLLTPDPKVWARVFLGVGAAQQINKALDIKPPPWLNAIETVAILHPLMVGFSKNYPLEVGVMAPMVAGVVTLANWLTKQSAEPLKEQAGIPPLATRMAISIGLTLASLAVFPKAINLIAKTGILGAVAKETALQGKNVVLGAVAIGANCGCGNIICVTQMGEVFGGMANWFQQHTHKQPSDRRDTPWTYNSADAVAYRPQANR